MRGRRMRREKGREVDKEGRRKRKEEWEKEEKKEQKENCCDGGEWRIEKKRKGKEEEEGGHNGTVFCICSTYMFGAVVRDESIKQYWKHSWGRILAQNLHKVLRVFLLAIHSHLYSFALRFIFLQTHATSYIFYSSVTVHCKGERRKTWQKTKPPSCLA